MTLVILILLLYGLYLFYRSTQGYRLSNTKRWEHQHDEHVKDTGSVLHHLKKQKEKARDAIKD